MKPDTRKSAPRVAAHRARLRAAGLRPIEMWAQPQHHEAIRAFAATLEQERQVQNMKIGLAAR